MCWLGTDMHPTGKFPMLLNWPSIGFFDSSRESRLEAIFSPCLLIIITGKNRILLMKFGAAAIMSIQMGLRREGDEPILQAHNMTPKFHIKSLKRFAENLKIYPLSSLLWHTR